MQSTFLTAVCVCCRETESTLPAQTMSDYPSKYEPPKAGTAPPPQPLSAVAYAQDPGPQHAHLPQPLSAVAYAQHPGPPHAHLPQQQLHSTPQPNQVNDDRILSGTK